MPDLRTRRRDATREEILAAAWRLAELRGLDGLSLRELAAEVGMRAPSLYTYFESKGAIHDAMFAEGYRELDALFADASTDGEPREVLCEALSRWLRFCLASIPRYQLMFTRTVAGWEPSPEAYRASVATYDRMVAALEALGIRGSDAVDLWTALTAGLAAQQVANDPEGDRWVRLVPEVVDLFLLHLDRRTP